MKEFKSKEKIFEYIKKKFSKNRLILIRGSSVNKSLNAFSDVDAEVYGAKEKPYYELILLNDKPILLSIYFYKYKIGKKIKAPKEIKIISGEYNENIKPDFSSDTYNPKQKIIRETQLAIDFMFKYLRSKNKKYLESVQKRI